MKTLFGILLLLGMLVEHSTAQTDRPFFRYPQEIPKTEYHHLLQLASAKLPEDVVEAASSLIRAPLFEYKALYGLPYGLAVTGGLSSNIITYHIALGVRWQTRAEPLTFAVGYDVAYWFGQLKSVDGFDTSVRGWLNYPNISVGYKVEDVAITVAGELILSTHVGSFVGDTEVATNQNAVAGYSVALYVEQPLWEDNYVLLGVKSNYARLYYPLWAAFSTFDRYFFIPEFIAGFVL